MRTDQRSLQEMGTEIAKDLIKDKAEEAKQEFNQKLDSNHMTKTKKFLRIGSVIATLIGTVAGWLVGANNDEIINTVMGVLN